MTEAEFAEHERQIRPLLWHYARRLTRPGGTPAEDLVQSALLALWEQRAKAASHPTPVRWFAQAARWQMFKVARDGNLRQMASLVDGGQTESLAYSECEPDEFEAIVGRLDPTAADLLRRRFRDGEHLNALARAAGVSSEGIRLRVNAAVDQLRKALAG